MKNVPALFVKAAQAFMKTHKHQLIFAGGVAGTLATGATGVRSGIRIEKKRREQEILKGDLTKKDILKIALPELVPVALSAGGSIGCQTANLVSFTKEVNALTAGIASLSTQIDKMKAAERDILGPEKAEEIQKKAMEAPSEDIVSASPTGKYWFKDVYSGAEFYTTMDATLEMLYNVRARLTWEDVTINEMYMYLEKGDSRNLYNNSGEYLGWKSGKTNFEWRFGDGHLECGMPCRTLWYTEPFCLLNRMY